MSNFKSNVCEANWRFCCFGSIRLPCCKYVKVHAQGQTDKNDGRPDKNYGGTNKNDGRTDKNDGRMDKKRWRYEQNWTNRQIIKLTKRLHCYLLPL